MTLPKPILKIFTARSSYASAVLGIVILLVRLFIRLFVRVTHVLCEETKKHSADVLILNESFLIPTEVGGQCPLVPEICA